MTENDESSKINRRNVLKATAATGSVSLLSQSGLASVGSSDTGSSAYHVGQVLFTELALEQKELSESDIHTEDAATHVLSDSLLALRHAPTAIFRKQNVVASYERNYYAGGEQFGGTTSYSIPVESDYDLRQRRSQLVEGTFEHPEIEVSRDGQSVVVTTEGTSVRVEPGTEERVELEQVEFTRQTTGDTQTTTPVLKIRNNGRVDVYGSTEARVLPRNTDEKWVNWRMQGYLDNPDVKTDVTDKVVAAYPPSGK